LFPSVSRGGTSTVRRIAHPAEVSIGQLGYVYSRATISGSSSGMIFCGFGCPLPANAGSLWVGGAAYSFPSTP